MAEDGEAGVRAHDCRCRDARPLSGRAGLPCVICGATLGSGTEVVYLESGQGRGSGYAHRRVSECTGVGGLTQDLHVGDIAGGSGAINSAGEVWIALSYNPWEPSRILGVRRSEEEARELVVEAMYLRPTFLTPRPVASRDVEWVHPLWDDEDESRARRAEGTDYYVEPWGLDPTS